MTRATIAALVALAGPAHAWDAATTHAGLTERAALASRLGAQLAANGRPLALWEPLKLQPADDEAGRTLAARLDRLDAAQGYAPDHGRLPAIEWLVAGAVLEEVPPARARNHFYDPSTGRGLEQGGFFSGLGLRFAAAEDGSGTVRGVFSGASFDGTGRSAIDWLSAADNDLSVARFLDARERATAAATADERDRALAEALLAAGGIAAVVEDAADPPYVRSDFRVALGQLGGRLDRLAARRYGRLAVPAPSGGAEPIAHLIDAVKRVAWRTRGRFFSEGSLPGAGATTPAVSAGDGAIGWASGEGVAHLARWERGSDGTVAWSLDERCLADYAERLLPEAARGGLTAIDFLFRGGLALEDGQVKNGPLALGRGTLILLADDEHGRRRELTRHEVSLAEAGARIAELPATPEAHLAVLFRGVDLAGEPIIISVESAK